jgi:hypothetical protein
MRCPKSFREAIDALRGVLDTLTPQDLYRAWLRMARQ